MRITTTLVTAALGIAGLSQQAGAQEVQTTQVVVPYHDLDLSSAAGAATMLTRIESAARTACGGGAVINPDSRLARLRAQRDFSNCQREAIESALAQLHAPEVDRAFAAAANRRPQG